MPSTLDDPTLYADKIRKLAKRPDISGRSDSVSLAALRPHTEELARRLAKDVPAGNYAFKPLVPREVPIQGKMRTLYQAHPLDAVVWGVIAQVFSDAFDPHWGEHLFSYRKGRSQWSACRALLHYLRRHSASCVSPRERGVFVLRRDVRRYGESLAVHDHSTLWSTLADLSKSAHVGLKGPILPFLQEAMRPPIQHEDGTARPLAMGVPTGLALQAVACNAYLLPLDRMLAAIPEGFYARFGDDLLFAHPDIEVIESVQTLIQQQLERLELACNESKSANLWLTLPGRAHATALALTPRRHFAYLGFDVGFDGARLRADKRRDLIAALSERLKLADAQLGRSADDAERAEVLCSVVHTILDPSSQLSHRYAPWLRFEVMSREDLLQLDHHIALRVAEQVTSIRGVRAFRKLPPRALYQQFGLPSLVRRWDQARKNSRGSQ